MLSRQRLIDDVTLVGFHLIHLPVLDQLDHPARVEIDHEADAAAVLRQVLDGQPQPPRAARSDHQPVGPFRERIIGERFAEVRIVDPEVLVRDSRLRHTGAAAGLEHVDRLVRVRLRDPPPHRTAAQPFVLKEAEPIEVAVPLDVDERIEVEAAGAFQPERTPGRRVEVPAHDVADVGIEPLLRGTDSRRIKRGCVQDRVGHMGRILSTPVSWPSVVRCHAAIVPTAAFGGLNDETTRRRDDGRDDSRVGSSSELLPLIEPDMQISSIRLTDTRRHKAHARR